MTLLSRAWAVVKENRRAYIVLNIAYYGLVALGMVYVAYNPALQRTLLQAVGQSFVKGPMATVGGAYSSGRLLAATALTFAVNLVMGSFFEITVPSLVVPFAGLLMGSFRALLWGLLLSPAAPELARPMVPHSLTLILEGQGYILAMLAVYVQGRAFLWPRTVGEAGHWRGYLAGLKRTGLLYLLVALTLALAAIYEALEVIYIVPLLR